MESEIMKDNCIFCKIVNNELPSYVIYEDEIVKVFLNINPLSNGHTLIIPKKHFVDIVDIPIDTLNHISKISKDIYILLKEKLNFDGLKFVQNNGEIQEIKHFHLHLIPYYTEKDNKSIEEVYNIIKK